MVHKKSVCKLGPLGGIRGEEIFSVSIVGGVFFLVFFPEVGGVLLLWV